jgi:hypothetical protein
LLSDVWRDNNVDHASKLLSAWIEFNPYLNSASLVRHCRDRGVAVHALRCLGPLDVSAHQLLGDPVVTELAQIHGRSPAQIIVKWCLSRVDGVVLDSSERVLVSSLEDLSEFDLSPDEMTSLDGLHCGYRIDRSPSTLASIHGSLAAEPMQVRPADTDQLEADATRSCMRPLRAPKLSTAGSASSYGAVSSPSPRR